MRFDTYAGLSQGQIVQKFALDLAERGLENSHEGNLDWLFNKMCLRAHHYGYRAVATVAETHRVKILESAAQLVRLFDSGEAERRFKDLDREEIRECIARHVYVHFVRDRGASPEDGLRFYVAGLKNLGHTRPYQVACQDQRHILELIRQRR